MWNSCAERPAERIQLQRLPQAGQRDSLSRIQRGAPHATKPNFGLVGILGGNRTSPQSTDSRRADMPSITTHAAVSTRPPHSTGHRKLRKIAFQRPVVCRTAPSYQHKFLPTPRCSNLTQPSFRPSGFATVLRTSARGAESRSSNSEFLMVWTQSDMPRQDDRQAIVTGANGGLGSHISLELARAGAEVVMASRDVDRGERAADDIRSRVPHARLRVLHLDLANLASVHAFAARYDETCSGLDLLVNNAGVMAVPRSITTDGYERQFATNHLGHFSLTGLLLSKLHARPAPRVVTVTSAFHRFGKLGFSNPQLPHRYAKWRAYSQSKLANLLFTYELARQASAQQSPLRSVAAHPGFAATDLQLVGPRMSGSTIQEKVALALNRCLAQSPAMGAMPILYAATAEEVTNGAFAGPDGLFGAQGYPKLARSSRASNSGVHARHLWDLSERLTTVRYDFNR